MSDVRLAYVAQADALETVVSAIASKQQASIAALRRQVDAIVAWQSEVESQSRANGGQGVASYSGGYDQQAVDRGQASAKGEQGVEGVAGSDGTRQSWAEGEQYVDDAATDNWGDYNTHPIGERNSARREQDIAGAVAGGYDNQPTYDEQSQTGRDRSTAAGGDDPILLICLLYTSPSPRDS